MTRVQGWHQRGCDCGRSRASGRPAWLVISSEPAHSNLACRRGECTTEKGRIGAGEARAPDRKLRGSAGRDCLVTDWGISSGPCGRFKEKLRARFPPGANQVEVATLQAKAY